MKHQRLILALILLILPILGRTLWFYQGSYQRSEAVQTPDYAALQKPTPVTGSKAEPVKNAAEKKEAQVVVLIDQSHNNAFYLSEIEPLTDAITRSGARLILSNPSTYLGDYLKYVQAYVVIALNSSFSEQESQAVQQFVRSGGRLLVITDPTRSTGYSESSAPITGTDIANQLLDPFKITFMEDYLYNQINNEGNFRNILISDLAKDDLTQGIQQLAFYSAHSLKTSQKVLAQGDENTRSSLTDNGGKLTVAASAVDGRVLALGDLSFMNTPYNQVAGNQQFIFNLAGYLTNSRPEKSLANFPRLFTRPISLLLLKSESIGQKTVGTIAILQKTAQFLNLKLNLVKEPQKDQDLIILGTYASGEELLPYLKDFKIDFSGLAQKTEEKTDETQSASNTATPAPTPTPNPGAETTPQAPSGMAVLGFPGLDTLSPTGVGIILYHPGAERNTLVLIAEDESGLQTLSTMLYMGDLSTCAVQENAAICQMDSSGSGGGSDSSSYSE